MILAIDFDGTCVVHEYPEVGRDVGAQKVLRELVDAGHKLILWTMRSGEELAAAVEWFEQNGIPLFGVNRNPEQSHWTSSPKAYCHLYIDDAALGVPLVYPSPAYAQRPFVDWPAVRELLVAKGILK